MKIARAIGSILKGQSSPLDSLSFFQKDNIESFEKQLNRLAEISEKSKKMEIYLQLTSEFKPIFSGLKQEQAKCERINTIYTNYIIQILNFYPDLFDFHPKEVPTMFNSLSIIASQTGALPYPDNRFVELYYLILRTAKNGDIQCLSLSNEFSPYLFQNKTFFNEFIATDGLLLIFTSFFIPNNEDVINTMLYLLFDVVPIDFFTAPCESTIEICLHSLKPENSTSCAVFLCNLLVSLSYNRGESVLSDFYESGGFSCLNDYLIAKDDPESAQLCYLILNTKSHTTIYALKSLYDLYSRTDKFDDIVFNVLNELDPQIIQQFIPIDHWILPKTTIEQVMLLAEYIKKVGFKDGIDHLLSIILDRPELESILFNLLSHCIQFSSISEMPYDHTLESQLRFFINQLDNEHLNHYLTATPFDTILLFAYKHPFTNTIRKDILSKVFQVYTSELFHWMNQMLTIDLNCDVYQLFIEHMDNSDICDLLVKIIETGFCQYYYHYFIANNGFKQFDVLLEKQKQDPTLTSYSKNILTFIKALTINGQRASIDDWVLSLNNDSPLFNDEYIPFLSDIAVNPTTSFLNVPSFLLFNFLHNSEKVTFDLSSPVCLYNAGKYGLKMFLKRNIDIKKLSCLDLIVNRYCDYAIYNQIEHDYENYSKYIQNVDHISSKKEASYTNIELFEFYNSGNPTSNPVLSLNSESKQIKQIFFRFFIPKAYQKVHRIPIFRSDGLEINFLKGSLVFKSTIDQKSIEMNLNDFVQINIEFLQLQIKIIINSNQTIHIKTEILPPLFIFFGGSFEFNCNDNITRLFIDRYIFINYNLALFEELSDGVYKVPLANFHSFIISDRIRTEDLYQKLETQSDNNENFMQLFNSILYLIKSQINNLHSSFNISKDYLIVRLIQSLKKNYELIQPQCLLYFYQLPFSILTEDDFATFLMKILTDYELYFLFSPESLLSFFRQTQSILDDSVSLVETFISNKMVALLLSIIQHTEHRTGLAKEILLIIQKLLIHIGNDKKYQNDESLNQFIFKAVTCSYLQKDSVKYDDLNSERNLFELSKEVFEEKRCTELDLTFFTFLKKILKKIKTEKITLSELLTIAGCFNDERSIYMFKLLNEYSYRNPNYITADKVNLIADSFSHFIEKEEIWLIILTILFGKQKIFKEFPETPMKIERPKFLPVFLSLFVKLLSTQCYLILNNEPNHLKDLIHKLLTIFLSIPLNEITINPIYILLLSNLGIIPKTIQLSFDSPRTQLIFPSLSIKISPTDLHDFDLPAYFLDSTYEHVVESPFPGDIENLNFLNEIEFDSIIELITKLLIATNLNDLKTMIVGNALMYTNYQKLFVKKLIFRLLEKVNKNLIGIVLQAIHGSIFVNSDYLTLLDLVFKYIHRTNLYSKELREIIIISFTFITEETEVEKRNALMKENLDIVLNPQMNEDADYIDIVHVCAAIDFNYRPRISHQMIAIKLSERDVSISPNFDISDRLFHQSQSDIPSSIQIANIDLPTIRISNAKRILDFYIQVSGQIIKQKVLNQQSFISFVKSENKNKYDYLELYTRTMEQWHFRFLKMDYKLNQNYYFNSKFTPNSYYLSEITQPYYSPRNIFPSPFHIKCPPNDGSQQTMDSFQLEPLKSPLLKFPNGWCFDNKIFKYSHVFDVKFDVNSKLLKEFVRIYGMFTQLYEIELFYYIHSIPSLLFVYPNRIVILILANKSNMLLDSFDNPILLIPLSQQILLSEFHESTLFCGHYVLTLSDDRLARFDDHYYMHEKRSLSLFYLNDPNIVIHFKTIDEMNDFKKNKYIQIDKTQNNSQIFKNSDFNSSSKNKYNLNLQLNAFNYNQIECFKSTSKSPNSLVYSLVQSLPEQSFFFINNPTYRIIFYWLENVISSFDYLVYLNMISARAFTDIGQYPVFPWVANPKNCTKRDLSKPLGQINPEKARHYDEYYEMQNYYYGVHYSHQAAICYYLARVPPFNYLWWNFNKGWDNPARFFSSITAAYEDVINENTADLKEEIPELFSIPEILQNDSNLNCIPADVKLPQIHYQPTKVQTTTQDNPQLSNNDQTSKENDQPKNEENPSTETEINESNQTANDQPSNNMNHSDINENDQTENIENSSTVNENNQDQNEPQNPITENINDQNEQQTDNNVSQIIYETGVSCSPFMFVSINRKLLEQSTNLNDWIDLIFGYKQTGDEAKLSKNIFHPASYHRSTAESSNMKQNEFEDHATFFGQCPEQKFVLKHPLRRVRHTQIQSIEKVNLKCLNDISDLYFDFTLNNEQKKPLRSPRTRKFSLTRLREVESSSFSPTHSIYMSTGPIDQFFLTSGIDKHSPFLEFDNELNRISGRIRLKWKLINGNGIIIPYKSMVLRNNNLNDLINLNAINPQAILTPSSPFYLTKTKAVYVCSIENSEFISIRKMENSNIQTIKSVDNDYTNSDSFSISPNFASTSELLVLFKDEHSPFLHHMSCSPDGVFICCCYTCGLFKLFKIEYEKSVPRQIQLIRSISQNDEIVSTAISSRDLLTFTLTKSNKLSIFSIANGLKMREFSLNEWNDDIVDILYDDFDGVISVLMSHHLVQFSSNGNNKLREISFDDHIKLNCFALLDLDFQFDKRILVVGDDHGNVYFISVVCPILELNDRLFANSVPKNTNDNDIQNNGKLTILEIKKEFMQNPISSIYVDKTHRLVIANDLNGNSSIMHIKELLPDNKILPRCEKCLFEMTGHCGNCGSPICPSCNPSEICYACIENNFGMLMK